MNQRTSLRARLRYARFAVLGVVLVTLFGMLGMTLAEASQDPANCNENDFILQLKQDPGPIYTVGQTINYSVRAGNEVGTSGCNISDVTITLTTPDGVVHTQQTGGVYPFTTTTVQVGPLVPYVADINDAVAGPCGNVNDCPVIITTAKATGLLHDDPIQDDPFTVIKQVSGPIVAPPLPHYLCYELNRTPPVIGNRPIADQFGNATLKLDKMHHLCTPADKNDEEDDNATRAEHLTLYDANPVGALPAKGKKVSVQTQFGTAQMKLGTVHELAVPASKSRTSPPGPLVNGQVDPFTCYTVSGSGPFTKIPNVKVDDQFGTLRVDVTGIDDLCTPTAVNGVPADAPTHARHLLCYSVRLSPGQNFTGFDVFVNNVFEQKKITLDGHVNDLCVPATKTVLP